MAFNHPPDGAIFTFDQEMTFDLECLSINTGVSREKVTFERVRSVKLLWKLKKALSSGYVFNLRIESSSNTGRLKPGTTFVLNDDQFKKLLSKAQGKKRKES